MNSQQQTVLVVDDTPENLTVLGQLLRTDYRVKVAPSGQRALLIAAGDPRPDLILLDVMMPEMDGYEVLERLRADPTTRNIPVIFVTAMDGAEDEERGLKLGAVDYITKPIKPAVVLARVATHLELKRARDWLADQNSYLEAEVERRIHHNQVIQDISIRALADLAETRDSETGNHIRRTQAYVEVLASHLKPHPRFSPFLDDAMIRLVTKSAPLHDIGKVGIPDNILLKPGRLDPNEFEIMKRHSRIGGEAIDHAMRGELTAEEYAAVQIHCRLGAAAPTASLAASQAAPLGFLGIAKDIAMWHHEKWDGSGYPDGLAGEAIPIPARLMAVADVFDALVSKRIYKPAMPMADALAIIREGSGTHFDPDIVEALMANLDRFEAILNRYADTDETLAAKQQTLTA